MNGWRSTSTGILLGTLALAACGKSGDNAQASGGASAAAPASAAPAEFPVKADSQATITGRVAFTGAKPVMARIDMSEEATCAQKHPQGAFNESVVVNGNNTLRNVYVYVKSGLPAGMRFPVPAEHVTLNQDGCQYKPHVFGVQAGQMIDIKNSDGILHNIKAMPVTNRPFNISQPTTMTTSRAFSDPEPPPAPIPLQCNVHSWMNGFVGVLSHPYFAVTGDDGTFSIGKLPPGTYVIEAWQEHYPAQQQTVTVGPKESKAITFTFHG
jgi:hypothetical protein